MPGVLVAALLGLVAALLAAALPAGAQTLRLGIPLEPPNLDPTTGAAAAVDEVVLYNLFEGLTRIGPDGRVRPLLAEGWEVSADGLEWRFRIRRGVTFHDGTPMTAADAAFSLNRARAPGSGNAIVALLAPIAAVEAPDAATLVIRLSRPMASLPVLLGWGDLVVVSPASVARLASAPVGTGPFRFAAWRRGDSITLVRNDAWWGPAPALERVVFRIVPDAAAAAAALRAGDIDAFPNFPAPEQLAALKRDPRFAVVVGTTEGETLLALNHRHPALADLRVRRALSHAIDRRAIIAGAMEGYGQPIGSHFSPAAEGYVDLADRYRFDPARARALLAEAGWGEGRLRLRLTLPPVGYARRSGEIVQAQLAAVGVRAEIEAVEWAPWLDRVLARHDFDMTIVSHTEPMDWDIYARPDYYFGWRSPAYDALVERLSATPDGPERRALLGRAQRLLAEEAVNVWLFQLPKLGVWRRGVEGLWADAPVQANDVTAVRLTGAMASAAAGTTARADAAQRHGRAWLWATLALAGLAALWLGRHASTAWVARRALTLALTLAAASLVVFAALNLAPGDPAAFMLGLNPDPAALARLRAELGLDRPWPARWAAWAGGLLAGDLGTSFQWREPVAGLALERLSVTLPLTLLALLLAVAIALPAAVWAATARGRPRDLLVSALAQLGVATPNFWLAVLLVLAFAVGLGWLPAGGFPGWEAGAGQALKALLLPALALALPQAAILTRVARAALVEALGMDHVRTARAKGLSRRAALWRHALPVAAGPVIAILGLQAGFLLAGAIIVETVFGLPGLGRLIFQAVAARDLVVVQSVVLLLVAAVVALSFLADLAAAALDPRLRERRA